MAVGQELCVNTGLSIGPATSPMSRDFYFAVGMTPMGTGALGDIRTGQIFKKQVLLTLLENSFTGRPKIVKVGAYGIVGDTDYGIKVEFRNSRFLISKVKYFTLS
jgi:hypothetical protein